MDRASTANHRLLSVHNHIAPVSRRAEGIVVVLPRGGTVTAHTTTADVRGEVTELRLNNRPFLVYRSVPSVVLSLPLSAVGTPYEGATDHIPKNTLLEISPPLDANGLPISKAISVADVWAGVYALFTLYRTNEHIPIRLIAIPNADEVHQYLLQAGLGRLSRSSKTPELADKTIFLSRAAFWQGAGTTGYHDRGWLPSSAPSTFPSLPSFTRSELVIASHPLRPPRPRGGEVLYRRYCAAVGQTLEFIAFDLGADEVSTHLATFHRWHNDERVNNAWGERGCLEKHRKYIEGVLADPGVLPIMMSWDGELMGYAEIVWVKENHVAQYIPADIHVGDWDRGLHVLVGEEKFLGGGRSAVWLRSLVHFGFLADPRTGLVIGEPKESNAAMAKVAVSAGFHVHTTIDFPYKRSVLIINPRERFFEKCQLY
ncbi:putative lysine N-acyltransferase C17G9.06c [Hypsizygus marmoreus]|uniref:Lysine N-acyltransferase C17G9.06c n=1 Tax=Hypsizygus marmoreus TaxID=39966 RepID=A0A369JPF7_HYPMA|nr:putative lysine N-acyltransferase C17G9.06c [Hypsizygus marmoreus]